MPQTYDEKQLIDAISCGNNVRIGELFKSGKAKPTAFLFTLLSYKSVQCAKVFIEYGLDINKSENQSIILNYANSLSRYNDPDMFDLVVNTFDFQNKNNELLLLACKRITKSIIQKVNNMKHLPTENHIDTVLYNALNNMGLYDVNALALYIKMLIKKGCNITMENIDTLVKLRIFVIPNNISDEMILEYACRTCCEKTMQRFLDNKICPSKIHSNHIINSNCYGNRKRECIKLLISYGFELDESCIKMIIDNRISFPDINEYYPIDETIENYCKEKQICDEYWYSGANKVYINSLNVCKHGTLTQMKKIFTTNNIQILDEHIIFVFLQVTTSVTKSIMNKLLYLMSEGKNSIKSNLWSNVLCSLLIGKLKGKNKEAYTKLFNKYLSTYNFSDYISKRVNDSRRSGTNYSGYKHVYADDLELE